MRNNIVPGLAITVTGLFAGIIIFNTPVQAVSQTSTNLFGQAQSYDVLLRGDSGAIVNARFQLSNNEDSAKNKYSYSLESGNLKTVTAYQEISCSNLPTIMSQSTSQAPTASYGSSTANNQAYASSTEIPECYPGYSATTNPDTQTLKQSTRYYAPSYNNIYKKIDAKITGNSFDLTLPSPLKSGKTTNVVMVYNASNISNKNFGVYKYSFATLKTNEQVVSANISISVDEGYYLAGSSKAKTNYMQKNSSSLNNALQSGATANSALDSSAQNYINSIGNNGMITKTANQILPGETFLVAGKFATSKFLLNWPVYMFICIAVLAIIGLLVFWFLIRRKRILKQESAQTTQGKNTAPDSPIDSTVESEKSQEPKNEAETYDEPANANYMQESASANVRSMPFYGLYRSARLKYNEKRIRPMFFAWLCALYLIIFVSFLTGIGIWYSNSFDSNGFGYSLTTTQTIFQAIVLFSLSIAGLLGVLVISVGLPYLYAKNAKLALKIISHIVLFFIVVAIVVTFVSMMIPDDKYNYEYGLPECNANSSICAQ